jgi:hypothetical protein
LADLETDHPHHRKPKNFTLEVRKWGMESYFVCLSKKANPLVDEVESRKFGRLIQGPPKPQERIQNPDNSAWEVQNWDVIFFSLFVPKS